MPQDHQRQGSSTGALSVALISTVACACGPSPNSGENVPATNSGSGMIDGTPMEVVSTTAWTRDNGNGTSSLWIDLWDVAGSCTARGADSFQVLNFWFPSGVSDPGTYVIVPQPDSVPWSPSTGEVWPQFATTSYPGPSGTVGCGMPLGSDMTGSGTLHLLTSGPTDVAGTFDVTFPSGHLSGTFAGPICAASDGATCD